MRRILAAATVLVIVVAGAAFATGTEEVKGAVLALSNVSGGKDDAENKLFEAAIEKGTGLEITWEKPTTNYDQTLLAKLGAGEPYDLVYMTQVNMYQLAAQGAIQDLTARIAKSKVYKENVDPAELEKIAFNGKYYAGFNKLEVFPLPNVNKAIADKVGVDPAKLATLDDYYQLLKKVKAYMETTGGKKPYYPFFVFMGNIWDLQPWFSSVGLKNGVFIGSDGKKTAPYLDAKAQPVWEWLAKLYKEGLMSPDSFTGKTSDMRNKMWQAQDIVLDSDWAAWTGLYNNNARAAGTYPDKVNCVGLPGVKGPNGKYLLEQGQASLWCIPVSSKNPAGGFKIIEYFATKEGGLLLTAGIAGNDYTMADGKITYTELGAKHGKDHGAPVPISKNFDMATLGPANPGFLESVALGKRADVSVAPMGFANGTLDQRAFFDTIAKWMTACWVEGKDAAACMKSAAEELRAKKVID
jgi:putative aldouronate transport system substrate-binding protein